MAAAAAAEPSAATDALAAAEGDEEPAAGTAAAGDDMAEGAGRECGEWNWLKSSAEVCECDLKCAVSSLRREAGELQLRRDTATKRGADERGDSASRRWVGVEPSRIRRQ